MYDTNFNSPELEGIKNEAEYLKLLKVIINNQSYDKGFFV